LRKVSLVSQLGREMRIIHKHYFGEITSGLDHFYLVLLFMVLLQYSSTIPQGEKSSGQLQVVNLI